MEGMLQIPKLEAVPSHLSVGAPVLWFVMTLDFLF